MSYIIPNDISITSVTASNHVSASYFFGDGSNLTNLPSTAIETSGNISGSGTVLSPVVLKNDISLTSVTASVLSASDVITDYLNFNSNTDPAWDNGRLWYNNDSHELNYWTEVSGFNVKLGQQLVQRCQNNSGQLLTKGTVVYITGSNNTDTPRITLADWTNDNLSANTLGLVAENIQTGSIGYVIVQGILKGINTNSYDPGTMLFLSSSGQITHIKPSAPKHLVSIGQVVRKQSSNGSIYVSIQNGYEIGELHDVLTNGKANGDLLVWDSSIPAWKNSTGLSGSYQFASTQTIDVSSSNAALRVTQRGAGDALRVEDSTNPDSSPFLVKGDGSVVIGRDAPYTGASVTIQGSLCNGYNTQATYVDYYSHAEGYGTIAYGQYTHTEGFGTQAKADNSHAEGEETITYGTGSHAEGASTKTFGYGSHTEGLQTITTGAFSHAEGSETLTYGEASHTEGLGTIASASYQHAQGKYNATSSTALMLVGNGTSDLNRSNILEVYTGSVVVSGTMFLTDLLSQKQSTKSSGSSGLAGQICWDSDYIYVCIATNTWKSSSLN